MRRVGGWLLVVALAGIALAAGLTAPGGEPPGAPVARLTGPDAPQPGALRGTLLVTRPLGRACVLAELDLATLRIEETGPETSCAGAGPGTVARAGSDRRSDGLLAVARVGESGPPAPSRAQPGPFGATADADERAHVVELEFRRAGTLERTVLLPPVAYRDSRARFGDAVEFAPGGLEVAVGAGPPGTPIVVVDVRSGRIVLPPTAQFGYAWSPDGAWLAVATGGEITVAGAVRDEAVYRLPLAVRALAWRPW